MALLALAALLGCLMALSIRGVPTALVMTIVCTAGGHILLIALTDFAADRPPHSAIDRVLVDLTGGVPMLGTVCAALLSCGLISAWAAWGRREAPPGGWDGADRRQAQSDRRSRDRDNRPDRRRVA